MHHPYIDMASKGSVPFDNYGSYALQTASDRGNVLNRDHFVHLNYSNQLYTPYYLNYNQGQQMNQMETIEMSRADKMLIAARNARRTN